jgi:FKBP-type peptidyl-prolyl cis-trans isomerase FkpA
LALKGPRPRPLDDGDARGEPINNNRRGRAHETTAARIQKMKRLLLIFALLASACGSSTTSPSQNANVPFSMTDLTVGTGTTATAGRVVSVNYTGWLYDASKPDNKGTQFDSNAGRGAFQFTLGFGQVIAGWDQGVAGMKIGGTRRLIIPPSLGYGSAGAGSTIPGNATLVFDVALVGVQ